jgi:integrase
MPYKEGERFRASVMVDGKRRSKIFNTKREAQRWEAEQREAMSNATESALTFLELCVDYLAFVEKRYSVKTLAEKKRICHRALSAFLPDTPADEITPRHILHHLDSRAESMTNNAANVERKNLLAMWNHGVKYLGLTVNPVIGINRLPHDRSPQYTPSQEDVLKVLLVANPEEKVLLSCYLHTAARKSEVLRWNWIEDINFEKREVRLGTRKNKDGAMSYELLPMNDDLYAQLWWWYNNRPLKDSPWVFCINSPNRPDHGNRYNQRRRFMAGLCLRAGVREFGFHALRRYVASILADTHKVSAKTIQRILRHKSVTTTERYIQNVNNDLASVMAKLNDEKEPSEVRGKIQGKKILEG